MADQSAQNSSDELTFQDIDSLVAQYLESPRMRLKEQILELCVTRIQGMSSKQQIYTPSVVDQGDLFQEGMMAVLSALDTYDPNRGAAFWTYCFPKVKGSMLDLLRKVSSKSRSRNVHMESLDALEGVTMPDFVPTVNSSASDILYYILMDMDSTHRSILMFLMHGLTVRTVSRLLDRKFGEMQTLREEAVKELLTRLQEAGFANLIKPNI